jgi:hypothetical protein
MSLSVLTFRFVEAEVEVILSSDDEASAVAADPVATTTTTTTTTTASAPKSAGKAAKKDAPAEQIRVSMGVEQTAEMKVLIGLVVIVNVIYFALPTLYPLLG